MSVVYHMFYPKFILCLHHYFYHVGDDPQISETVGKGFNNHRFSGSLALGSYLTWNMQMFKI